MGPGIRVKLSWTMEQTLDREPTSETKPSLWKRYCRFCHRTYAPVGGFSFVHAFRLQFWRFGLAQGTPGAVWLSILALQAQGSWRVGIFVLAATKVILSGFVCSAIVNRFFPIHLSEWGIRGRSLWGNAHEVAWEDMDRVKPIRWLVFTRFLRLHTKRRKDLIWVPLFLTDMEGFKAALQELAPEENPLRKYFDEGGR